MSFVVVQQVDFNQKKLFVGDVLWEEGPSDENPFLWIYKNLSKNKEFLLNPRSVTPATNEDIYGAFIAESAGWVSHGSGDKIHYVAKIDKIDLPYLFHSLGGADFVYNYLPASNEVILKYRKEKLLEKGIKEGVVIKDDMEIEGVVVDFELDPHTREVLIRYKGASSKVIYSCKESAVVEVLPNFMKEEVYNPGDYIRLDPTTTFPFGIIMRVSKTDVNAFYSEECDEWFSTSTWKWRRATKEEVFKMQEFDGMQYLDNILSEVREKLQQYPPNEYHVLSWYVFGGYILSKVVLLFDDVVEKMQNQ